MQLADQSIRFPGGRVGFLLIHGLGGTPIEMRYVAQGLARAGHTVHVPQLAGHCGSAEELERHHAGQRLVRQRGDGAPTACGALRHDRGGRPVDGSGAGRSTTRPGYPREVSALALYAPSLWLDGWGIPWYSHFFKLVTQKWLADMFPFAERDPWGIKDPRIRALVEQAIKSGDSSRAGIAALPGGLMLELRWLVQQVKREVGTVQQPR